jgi:hypothetical protein
LRAKALLATPLASAVISAATVAGKLMWRPSDPAGAWRGIALDIGPPGAPACATQRAYPTHFINSFLQRHAQIRFLRQVASAIRFHRHTIRRNYTGRMTRCRLDDGIARYVVSRASRRRERRRAWYRYGAGYHRGATSATRGVAFREGEATMANGSAEVNDRLMSAYRRHRQYHRLIVPVPISLQHPGSPVIDVILVCSPPGFPS